ncbi:MAG: leucine-rich repeat protein [Chitinispirillales bacterium]|jgi:hypothetical protein|nr:leucine-rich repeat protein [Chitinispirillales bacterium]
MKNKTNLLKILATITIALTTMFLTTAHAGTFTYTDINEAGTLFATLDDDGTLTISGDGEMDDWDSYDEQPWFYENEEIRKIVFTGNITHIGEEAFSNCANLSTVVIPQGVTTIGGWAFQYCEKLKSVTIGKDVETIGEWAFYDNPSLEELTVASGNTNFSVVNGALLTDDGKTLVQYTTAKPADNYTIPAGVEFIRNGAFAYCYGIGSLVIPDHVIKIGDFAFANCGNLATVSIGNGVEIIFGDAFADCGALTEINVSKDNAYYASSGGALFDGDMKKMLKYPEGKQGAYTIPAGVETIDLNVFANCMELTSIVIPSSVNFIGDWAFASCKNLSSVTVGSGVEIIGGSAFNGCTALKTITIPANVTFIFPDAFANCDALTEINVAAENNDYTSINGALFNKDKTTLIQYPTCKQGAYTEMPASVTTITNSAFSGCKGLTAITIGENVETIGHYAFFQCEKLASVNLPASVTEIGDCAFKGCESMAELVLGGGVEIIGEWAFAECKNITSVTIPASVTDIGEYTFFNCESMTQLVVGEGVETIGNSAFEGCASLTSANLPQGVTDIGDWAFAGCESLAYLTIPASVTDIGYMAFFNCASLASVKVSWGTVGDLPLIQDDAFRECRTETVWLDVPAGKEDMYAAADVWQGFYIEGKSAKPSGQCGDYLYYEYNPATATLTIEYTGADPNTQTGDMWDENDDSRFPNGTMPWVEDNYSDKIRTLDLQEGITYIGFDAFYHCTALTDVNIPQSVTRIGMWAFDQCHKLTSITIPAGVIEIGGNVFNGCSALTEINVAMENNKYASVDGALFNKDRTTLYMCPEGKQGAYAVPVGVLHIESFAFFNCDKLTSVSISADVKTIGIQAFFNCRALTEINVAMENNKYASVDGALFNKDKTTLVSYPGANREAYSVPTGVRVIEAFAFGTCASLTSLDLPEGIERIEEYAFYNANLTSVNLPESIEYIGRGVFDIRSLTSVTNHAAAPLKSPDLDEDAFGYLDLSLCTLYVPTGSVAAYKAAPLWEDFAVISAITYSVTYLLNGGVGGAPTQTPKAPGATFAAASLPAGVTAPSGKHFVGWNTKADGSGENYSADANVTMPASNLTLYAMWETDEDDTPIREFNKSDGRTGIRLLSNIVSDKAVITIDLPDNERVSQVKAVIYDNVGNVVFEKTERSSKVEWNLINFSGRYVANGMYMILVEAKSVSGKTYAYSAKLGVRK